MLKNLTKFLIIAAMLTSGSAYAVLPTIFANQSSGNVAASLLDTNFTFLESQGVQALNTTGSSNAYVATPADEWLTGYASYVGRALTVVPNFSNTSASTINVSSLGTASIYKNISGTMTALASGDMTNGIPAILICDGTGFLLANPASANGAPLNSPTFTGTPAAPTAAVGTSTTQIATTAFANPATTNSTNGSVEMPGGTIIAWGTGTGLNISFPTPFPNNAFACTTSLKGSVGSGDSTYFSITALSTTGFTVANSSSAVRYYICIGN